MKSKQENCELRKLVFRLSILALFLSLSFWTTMGYTKDPTGQKTVRVAVKTNVPLTQEIVDELAQYGQVGRRMWRLNIVDMRVPVQNLSQLEAHPLVQYVERDQEIHFDGFSLPPLTVEDTFLGASMWNLDIINVTDHSALHPDPFWWLPAERRVVDFDGDGVYVAVIDSGLSPNWRDYFPEAQIDQVHATAFTGGQAGFEETSHGIAAQTDGFWQRDTTGHGTAVTSVILGFRNTEFSELIADPQAPQPIANGVAPRAKIIPIKIEPNGPESGVSASIFDLVAGIYYVARLRESGEIIAPIVINMSVGSDFPSPSTEEAIDFAIAHGVIIVAAGGNEGSSGMSWPGAYPAVISAVAIGWLKEWMLVDDEFFVIADVPEEVLSSSESFIANFSSREKPGQQLDVAAPGVAVFAPFVQHGAASPDNFRANNLNFIYFYGASSASPHVAGVAALMMQKNPDLSQTDVEAILKETAIPILQGPGIHTDPSGIMQNLGFGSESVWGDCPEADTPGICPEEQGSGLIQADKALDATP